MGEKKDEGLQNQVLLATVIVCLKMFEYPVIPLVMTELLKMAIEIVSFPAKNGDVH